jgi:SAM-dependent methyltransferase
VGGYVHPKAAERGGMEGAHALALDVASDASPNYLSWVGEQVRPHLGANVLEVGSGLGSITQHLAEGRRLVATDIDDTCVAGLHERFDGVDNVEVVQADLRNWETDEEFDSVVMINVLEHIEDDAGALAGLSRFLKPGGSIVIYVPALNGLYGPWDLTVGHYRRYSRPRLRSVFEEAGLEPGEIRYANLLGIPAWVAFSRFSKADATSVGKSLPIWDRIGVPAGRFLERHVRVPIGLNVLGVARRPVG